MFQWQCDLASLFIGMHAHVPAVERNFATLVVKMVLSENLSYHIYRKAMVSSTFHKKQQQKNWQTKHMKKKNEQTECTQIDQ